MHTSMHKHALCAWENERSKQSNISGKSDTNKAKKEFRQARPMDTLKAIGLGGPRENNVTKPFRTVYRSELFSSAKLGCTYTSALVC